MRGTLKATWTAVALAAVLCWSGGVAAQNAKPRIAVIPKGTTHVFWKSVEAGARQAGQEAGGDIVWKGPLKENDRAGQIAIVEQFVSDGIGAIALAPLDQVALKRPVAAAVARKIPVVIIDSALEGQAGADFASLVATDNRKGGELGGDELARLLEGKGKVVLLRYQEGSASTMEREAGFLDAIRKHPGISVIVDNQYAGATAAEAQNAAMNMADKLRQADGVFCPNESSTFGMLLALRQSKLLGKLKFVGFDTSPPLLAALRKGEIQALVAQNPTKMGYEGVKAAIAVLAGKSVDPRIDTGCVLITPANLDSEPVKAVLGGS
jgi:ribose transport system substrate-binding protein